MAYRRYYRGTWHDDQNSKVTVSITWDQVTNAAYRVRFDNIGGKFDKVRLVIDLIKTSIPSSQYEYDPETKTWYIGEAYIKGIKTCCEVIPDFEVIYTERPTDMPTARMYPKEVDYADFVRVLSLAHVPWTDTTDFVAAKKAYFKAAMYLHPDRNPHMYDEMVVLNTVWDRLKENYFKHAEAQVL